MMQAILTGVGVVLTAAASVLGSWALILARRNERRSITIAEHSANKDETQQAFDLQQLAMENITADNERLRTRQGELHDTVNRLVGQLGVVTAQHRECEDQLDRLAERLRHAEARIHELGG